MTKIEQRPPKIKYIVSSMRVNRSKSIEGRKHSANMKRLLIKTCRMAIFIHESILKNIHATAPPTG